MGFARLIDRRVRAFGGDPCRPRLAEAAPGAQGGAVAFARTMVDEELLAERGVEADHVTVYRWVLRLTRRTCCRWLRPTIRSQSRHSAWAVRTQRSAYASASGARTGVRSTWAPCEQNTSSKLRQNFVSQSRSRKRTCRPRSPAPAADCGPAGRPQAPSGLAVTPARWTWRHRCSGRVLRRGPHAPCPLAPHLPIRGIDHAQLALGELEDRDLSELPSELYRASDRES
jgi:hypothetical protein